MATSFSFIITLVTGETFTSEPFPIPGVRPDPESHLTSGKAFTVKVGGLKTTFNPAHILYIEEMLHD